MARPARLQKEWSVCAQRAVSNGAFFGPDRCATTNVELDALDLPWEDLSRKCILVNFYGQRLTEVPTQLRAFHQVTDLNLGRNKLTKVPTWLNELPKLECLCIHENKLEELPPELGFAPKLNNLGLYATGRFRYTDKELWKEYEKGKTMHACSREARYVMELLRLRANGASAAGPSSGATAKRGRTQSSQTNLEDGDRDEEKDVDTEQKQKGAKSKRKRAKSTTAAANINQTVHLVQGRKFWKATQNGCSITVEYGKSGSKNESSVQDLHFANVDEAVQELAKTILVKLQKGYDRAEQ